ncbi:MAG TPA: efflux RND transporter periplasmic adaptor subunit [Gemmatimonadales bacterium]|nr:efflux RND transporter periplasmic adaptor subunit [Gemmatimonadales bacterium]
MNSVRQCGSAAAWQITALLILSGAAGCKDKPADAEAKTGGADSAQPSGAPVTLPVVGSEVRKGDLILSVVTTGQVRSEALAILKSETQGTITAVLVRPGDRVKKGQALLRVDPRPLELAVREAEARLEEARLKLLDNTVPDSIVTGKALTGERLKNAEIRAGLEGAKVALEKAKLEREKATITAPFDGVMDEVRVSVGERLSTGQEVGKVVDLQHLRIEAAVLEHDLPLIKVGGQAVVTAAAAPDKPVIGRIAAILPIVDSATRAGRAVIRTGGGVLRPGMYADIRLEANRLPNRIVVPASAIIQRDGRPLVFVVKDGRAQWVYIFPGRSNGAETEVLPDSASGQIPLKPGDVVIVEGHLTLTHDAPVRVVQKAEHGKQP